MARVFLSLGSSAEKMGKYLCDLFGFDEKNIRIEQIKQFF